MRHVRGCGAAGKWHIRRDLLPSLLSGSALVRLPTLTPETF